MASEEEDQEEEGINTNTNTNISIATPPPPRLQIFSNNLPSTLRSLSTDHHPARPPSTPPHHTHASVPFRWEAEPGKPKPCTTLALVLPQPTKTKSLDLPPRLLLNNDSSKMTKTPSPTTVLEGPYYPSSSKAIGRSIMESSSFRFLRKRQQGLSFDGALSLGDSSSPDPDRGLLLGPVGLSSSGSCRRKEKSKGLFGYSWKKRGVFTSFRGTKSEVGEGSLVFSCFDDEANGDFDGGEGSGKGADRMRRKKSLSLAKSHFWASIYGALKQIIPSRSTKLKKDDL